MNKPRKKTKNNKKLKLLHELKPQTNAFICMGYSEIYKIKFGRLLSTLPFEAYVE